MTFHGLVGSPLGPVLVTGGDHALTGLWFADRHPVPAGSVRDDARFAGAAAQLDAYWAGELREFDLPIRPPGTSFQQAVWDALVRIPYGTTVGYGELARRIGRPEAARAVGAANGRNPISVIVPCHRVIGAAGALTGYGGGLARKEWLLTHEGAQLGVPAAAATAAASGVVSK